MGRKTHSSGGYKIRRPFSASLSTVFDGVTDMIKKTCVPLDSSMQELVRNADFCDAFEVGIDDGSQSALYWYLVASRTGRQNGSKG